MLFSGLQCRKNQPVQYFSEC